jgi:molecular chaperone GrpE (heat shock protein)
MQTDDLIVKIKRRIVELQRSHVVLQEDLKKAQHSFERNTADVVLKIIDILDMLEMTKANTDLDAGLDAQLIIKKISRKLGMLLEHLQVQEILFLDGNIEAGTTRVLETRQVEGNLHPGTILEVCRKGYRRGNRVIRVADVITSKEGGSA